MSCHRRPLTLSRVLSQQGKNHYQVHKYWMQYADLSVVGGDAPKDPTAYDPSVDYSKIPQGEEYPPKAA